MKGQKGITLVALVITIIILLILAGISIVALEQSNLFENARKAENEYNDKAIEENTTLKGYENWISNYLDED